MKYSSVLSPYMYAYIKEKEAVGHAVTQTKWFFHELDIYFQQNNLTSIQITKEIYDGWYEWASVNRKRTTVHAKVLMMTAFLKYMCTVGNDCLFLISLVRFHSVLLFNLSKLSFPYRFA